MEIDGKKIAQARLEDLGGRVRTLKTKPKLAVIMVGQDPASLIYVSRKQQWAEKVGIEVKMVRLSETSTTESIERVIRDLNADDSITGILVQLPLPELVRKETGNILNEIKPGKDVDGLTGRSEYLPAGARAVLVAIQEGLQLKGEASIQGKTATVIGQGKLIGRPVSFELEKLGVRVNRCDELTDSETLIYKAREADILVTATGVEGRVTMEMVKPGAIVIDCGSPKAEVDFESVSKVAGAITPVPGGIGPLTVVCLLENVVKAAQAQINGG